MKQSLLHITLSGFMLFTTMGIALHGQEQLEQQLSFQEYLAFVKQHHPLAKQAALVLDQGEANLLMARGGFDPKVEVDYDRKKFKDTEYYDQLNATFKIPTWYGIELKANFEENTGDFLNPEANLPADGLYSAGVAFSLGEGLLINDRMADLKKARYFLEQTKADRALLINNLLLEASEAYFNWVAATNEQIIFESFLENAYSRLEAVSKSVQLGDKAAIDSVEARITWKNRQLNLKAAQLKKRKAALEASNFLWLNNVPVEFQENVVPNTPEITDLKNSLLLSEIGADTLNLNNHPKLLSLSAKIKGLSVDRTLKRNKILPTLDVQYNFLTPQLDQPSSLNTANYKAFVNFSVPLFLRKERGDAKLANLKLQDASYERAATSFRIRNKVTAVRAEITSLDAQFQIINEIVQDYTTLVRAEERKFELGESSLFLINSREQKLIDARLKENELLLKQLTAQARLFNSLGISIPPAI